MATTAAAATPLTRIVYIERDCNSTTVAILVPLTLLFIGVCCLYFWYYFYIRPDRTVMLASSSVELGEGHNKERVKQTISGPQLAVLKAKSCLNTLVDKVKHSNGDSTANADNEKKKTKDGSDGLKTLVRKLSTKRSVTALPVSMQQFLGKKSSTSNGENSTFHMPATGYAERFSPIPAKPSRQRSSNDKIAPPEAVQLVDEGLYASTEEVVDKDKKPNAKVALGKHASLGNVPSRPLEGRPSRPLVAKPSRSLTKSMSKPALPGEEPHVTVSCTATSSTQTIPDVREDNLTGANTVSTAEASSKDKKIKKPDKNSNDPYVPHEKIECIYNDLAGLDDLIDSKRLSSVSGIEFVNLVAGSRNTSIVAGNLVSVAQVSESVVSDTYEKLDSFNADPNQTTAASRDSALPDSTLDQSDQYELPSALLAGLSLRSSPVLLDSHLSAGNVGAIAKDDAKLAGAYDEYELPSALLTGIKPKQAVDPPARASTSETLTPATSTDSKATDKTELTSSQRRLPLEAASEEDKHAGEYYNPLSLLAASKPTSPVCVSSDPTTITSTTTAAITTTTTTGIVNDAVAMAEEEDDECITQITMPASPGGGSGISV